jgi:hypothetical protein
MPLFLGTPWGRGDEIIYSGIFERGIDTKGNNYE